MRIVWCDDRGQEADLEVEVRHPEATVQELVDALAERVGDERDGLVLVADDQVLPAAWLIAEAGALVGATLRLSPADRAPSESRPAPEPRTEVAVVGGLDAGDRHPIGPGLHRVGRGPGAPIELRSDTVSHHHLDLVLGATGSCSVTDAGSRNGTWRDEAPLPGPTEVGPGDVLRLGAAHLTVRTAPEPLRPLPAARPAARARDAGPGPPAGLGVVPLNRPPRSRPSPPPDAVVAPEPPSPPEPPAPIGLATLVAPVLLGVGMVTATRSAAYALILLLSPVIALAQVVDGWRRRRRHVRREARRWAAELARSVEELHRVRLVERDRLRRERPDLAALARRAETRAPDLWERRPHHPDWLRLAVGIGPERWHPPIEHPGPVPHGDVVAAVQAASTLPDAPVGVDLGGGGAVGLVGPPAATTAVARALVLQAAVLHGPADLTVVAATDVERRHQWDWLDWLPHGSDPAVVTGPEAEARARARLEHPGGDAAPTLLLVVDSAHLLTAAGSPVRRVLQGRAGPVAGIVVARTRDSLPAACSTIVTLLDGDGRARVEHVGDGEIVDQVVATGARAETAVRVARALAGLGDPEVDDVDRGLPARCSLLSLLPSEATCPERLVERWRDGGRDPACRTPLGTGPDGVVEVDLDRDGPHALVAGTTGAGKSELLRSLVAGLAVSSPPELLSFVLVDFKGGSAFDRCADLPHVVGLVTDLDAHLAQRALRCLDAELRRRERVLRDAGAGDLREHRALDAPPLARLVVVIDEFATLRAELPDFVDALVGVAQRGRSLGVHLVLATQRPGGAVSDSIRANTDLRIALRVQDATDSRDVIDRDDAAEVPRDRPGRALARLGPREVLSLQTALCSAPADDESRRVRVRPSRPGSSGDGVHPAPEDPARTTELDLLVAATTAAAEGRVRPSAPWPPLLGALVELRALPASAPAADVGPRWGERDHVVAFALADDPDHQEQSPTGWRPALGNLLITGMTGSGRSTALASLVLTATAGSPVHVQVLDMGAGALAALERLPAVGTVVGAGDRPRQARLLASLRHELDRRLAPDPPSGPPTILVIDGIGALVDAWDHPHRPELDSLARVFAEGPPVGIHTVVAGDRPADLPAPLRTLVRQQVVLQPADDLDVLGAGVRPDELPRWQPGRGIELPARREVQVAVAAPDLAEAVAGWSTSGGAEAPTIAPLPRHPRCSLAASPPDQPVLRLPVGLRAEDLGPAELVLHPGDHAAVLGPSRSGRSSALQVVAHVAARAGWRVTTVAPSASPLGDAHAFPSPAALLASGRLRDDEPHLVLIDDLDRHATEEADLEHLLARPGVRVVAAGRSDGAGARWSPWRRSLLASQVGLLLRPDPDLDGEGLGVRLPRRPVQPFGPGQGYLCRDGQVWEVEVAHP